MLNRAAEVNRDTRMPDKAFRMALPPGTDLSSVSAYQETDFRGRLLRPPARPAAASSLRPGPYGQYIKGFATSTKGEEEVMVSPVWRCRPPVATPPAGKFSPWLPRGVLMFDNREV